MKKVLLFVAMTLLLLVTGCNEVNNGGETGDQVTYDLAGKTYYNTIDDYGNTDHSKIWFGRDGSFVMRDNFAEGYYEISGTWSIKENVCTLEVEKSGVGNYKTIIFEIQDSDTLILKNTLAGSRSDNCFTTTKITGNAFIYGTYYNFGQDSFDLSYVELDTHSAFRFVDRNDLYINEIVGTYVLKGDTLTMTYRKAGAPISFDMLIKDPETLILQNDMSVSATGDVFSISDPSVPVITTIPCTGLNAPQTSYKVEINSSPFNLQVTTVPSDSTEHIWYTSLNDSIATVNESGVVTPGSKTGKTTIDVKCGAQSLSITVETISTVASSIDFDPDVLHLSMKQQEVVKAKVIPSTANQKLTFSSSDPSVATVDKNGLVIGQFLGKAKITATATNGISDYIYVYVEGETVIFEMKDNVSVKAASGQKIPYKAYLIICSGDYYSKQDVTLEVEMHTAYTSALDIDGNGNVYAKGAIYDTVDIPIYFTWNDGSSLNVTSQTFTVHVEK